MISNKEREYEKAPNTAWCVLINHTAPRCGAGVVCSQVKVQFWYPVKSTRDRRVRPPDSRPPAPAAAAACWACGDRCVLGSLGSPLAGDFFAADMGVGNYI